MCAVWSFPQSETRIAMLAISTNLPMAQVEVMACHRNLAQSRPHRRGCWHGNLTFVGSIVGRDMRRQGIAMTTRGSSVGRGALLTRLARGEEFLGFSTHTLDD
jgi:hypothetical protein